MSIGNPSTSLNPLSATGNPIALLSLYPRRFLLLVLLCLLTAIGIMGYLHYRDDTRNTKKIFQQQIQLIGELKAQEVARWFRQRRDTALAIKELPYAAGLQDFMTIPETSPGRQGVITWLHLLQNHFEYSAVALIDSAGKTIGSVPVADKVLAPQTRSVVEQTLQSGLVTFSDFYRISSSIAETDTASRLDFVIPLRASPAGDTSLLGVLVLEIDPNRVLFPLLESWPVPGIMGETLLVRRTPDQIVYLGPLRHGENQPVTLGLTPDTPELHENTVVESVNYRGEPVSAVLHAIPGSPWHLVTKMDRVEVENLLRRRMDHILLSAVFLLLVLGSLLWILWRRQADKTSTAANLALERQVQQRTAELKTEIERHRNTAVALQETENRLELAVEGANLGLWHLIFDPNHPQEIPDQIHGLPHLKAFIGYRDEKFPFSLRAWKQKILPEDREQVEQAMDDHLHWRAPDYASEYRIRHRDGTIRWIYSRGKIQRTETGRPLSWSGIDCDITALKQTEITVTRQQTLLQAILNQAQDGIVVCDTEGNFLLVNPAARRQAQFNPEGKPLEIAAQAWGKAYYPDGTPVPPREWASVKALQGHRSLGQEVRMVHDDGRYYNILISAGPLYREDGTLFGSVATFTDITERKKAEQTLKNLNAERTRALTEANAQLRQTDQVKSLFIASMSHELRTPLNSVIGFTGVLLQGMAGPLTEKQRDYLQRTKQSGHHLLALVDDIIDIAVIESGRLKPSPERFILDDPLQETVNSIKPFCREKGLDLSLEAPPAITLYSDRRRLLQCLLNLANNAVKYTDRGKIRITARPLDGRVEIAVQDTGIGFSREESQPIFQPFSRPRSRLARRLPGIGLGLYLTRKLVTEVLGGKIAVESEAGVGSTFRITIPLELRAGEEKSRG